ncbi:hypothetical protein N7532_003626 [Penicillium argentinense]|uniref:Uncharacterized protein n=1 Tax=Penicillium argentinense TaxID=1131581 RepID=A0A9W9KFD9_9EURO|nr:uncharacterized protein N7532_003626 [Penicillium argentinense]KAJ5103097.1 hypothetical protein N7532_003626 [Penicillium argentinense]
MRATRTLRAQNAQSLDKQEADQPNPSELLRVVSVHLCGAPAAAVFPAVSAWLLREDEEATALTARHRED